MLSSCLSWPSGEAEQYRRLGYWWDQELIQILERQVQTNPHGIAVIDGDISKSYLELEKEATRLACYLASQGVAAGDSAIVQLPNCYEFYVVFFALQKLAVVPVYALMNHQQLELKQYTRLLQPALILADAAQPLFKNAQFYTELQQQSTKLQHVYLRGQQGWAEDFTTQLHASACFNHFESLPLRKHNAENTAFFQLSGGSTGTPKLIPRSHNDYYYSIRQSASVCQWNNQTRYLCALPAAHNFPLSSPGALGVFYAGGTLVCAPDPSPSSCFPLIQRHCVTWTALVPPAVNLWLDAKANSHYDLSTLQVVQVGGAKLSATLAAKLEDEFGVLLQQVFGMAEGLVNYTRLDDDSWHRHHTQGLPMSGADQVRIVDDHNQPVEPGQPGLLTTKGPYTFRGYFNAAAHNLAAFTESGFYCSGDIVKQTPSGHLIVVGRDKDQINKGGEKVAAEEVENLLLAHPSVYDCALVAMPDALLGERICAFVVLKQDCPEVATRSHLLRFLRDLGLALYKLPDRIEFVLELPTTKVGKVDKRALRERIKHTLTPVESV